MHCLPSGASDVHLLIATCSRAAWFLWDGRSDARLGAHNWIICMKRPAAGGRPPRGPGRGRRAPDARPHRPPTPRHRNGPPPRRDGDDHGVRRGVRRRPGRATARAARLPRPHGHTEVSSLRHLAEQGVEFGAVEGLALGCAWTSTKRPSPVRTTFMSVSALTPSSPRRPCWRAAGPRTRRRSARSKRWLLMRRQR